MTSKVSILPTRAVPLRPVQLHQHPSPKFYTRAPDGASCPSSVYDKTVLVLRTSRGF